MPKKKDKVNFYFQTRTQIHLILTKNIQIIPQGLLIFYQTSNR